jgi:threonine/homoserine/homoserine lactone efflux protein
MDSLPLFIGASIALIVTPGPDIIYVLTRGIADGRWAGVISGFGVTSGILVHTLAASLGLAVLLKTSVYAFWTLKVIGGIYLIFLTVLGLFAGVIGTWLKERKKIAGKIRFASGSVLMLLGLRLLIPQRS